MQQGYSACIVRFTKKVKVVVDTADVPSSVGDPALVVNLMDKDKSVLTTLNSSRTLDEVHDFQQQFNSRNIGREAFLKKNENTPTTAMKQLVIALVIDCYNQPLTKSNHIKIYDQAMTNMSFLPPVTKPRPIFVTVTNL